MPYWEYELVMEKANEIAQEEKDAHEGKGKYKDSQKDFMREHGIGNISQMSSQMSRGFGNFSAPKLPPMPKI